MWRYSARPSLLSDNAENIQLKLKLCFFVQTVHEKCYYYVKNGNTDMLMASVIMFNIDKDNNLECVFDEVGFSEKSNDKEIQRLKSLFMRYIGSVNGEKYNEQELITLRKLWYYLKDFKSSERVDYLSSIEFEHDSHKKNAISTILQDTGYQVAHYRCLLQDKEIEKFFLEFDDKKKAERKENLVQSPPELEQSFVDSDIKAKILSDSLSLSLL